MSLFADFLSLIYPRNCIACRSLLFKHEQYLCNHCYVNIPKSDFHLNEESELAKVFYGRVPFQLAGSYYLFEKSGKVQRLLHHIKYKNNKALASQLGQWYAQSLKDTSLQKADLII